jgi:hypothetical protein
MAVKMGRPMIAGAIKGTPQRVAPKMTPRMPAGARGMMGGGGGKKQMDAPAVRSEKMVAGFKGGGKVKGKRGC